LPCPWPLPSALGLGLEGLASDWIVRSRLRSVPSSDFCGWHQEAHTATQSVCTDYPLASAVGHWLNQVHVTIKLMYVTVEMRDLDDTATSVVNPSMPDISSTSQSQQPIVMTSLSRNLNGADDTGTPGFYQTLHYKIFYKLYEISGKTATDSLIWCYNVVNALRESHLSRCCGTFDQV